MDLAVQRMNGTRVITTLAQDTDLSCPHVVAGTILSAAVLKSLYNVRHDNGTSLLSALLVLGALVCASPVLLSLLILLRLYRTLWHYYLTLTIGEVYQGLLDGPDAFWATDDPLSKSTINILAFVDFKQKDSHECINLIQTTLEQRLLHQLEHKYQKLLWRRHSSSAFPYWTHRRTLISDHVRLFRTNLPGENQNISETELKSVVSSLSNLDLPLGDSTNWEVILIDKMIQMKEGPLRPVLFRVHHSVADGQGLVDLFLNVLTESVGNTGDKTGKVSVVTGDGTENLEDEAEGSARKRDIRSFCEKTKMPKTLLQPAKMPPNKNAPNLSPKVSRARPEPRAKRECKTELYEEDVGEKVELYCGEKFYMNPMRDEITEQSPEKGSKPSFFKPNVARLNWNLLKSKTKSFIKRGATRDDIDNKDVEGETASEEKVDANNSGDKSNKPSRETVKKDSLVVPDTKNGKLHAREFPPLDLSEKRVGTLYMNDLYYTPLSPLNSSIILDCFSCKTKFASTILPDCQKAVEALESLLNQVVFPSCYLRRPAMTLKKLTEKLSRLVYVPINFLTKRVDRNPLHSKPLSNNKIISYIFDDNLFEMVKHIKTFRGVAFNEIVLQAVSDSLETYFADDTERINVIIPVPMSTERVKLGNDFTVCMFDLPVSHLSKADLIHKKYANLKGDEEILLNHYILKYIMPCLPNWLLKRAVKSAHSTLALSNMIGPQHAVTFSGHPIRRMIFFVPNKDTTGVGVTLLGYEDKLALGIIMDGSLGDRQDVEQILDNVKNAIYHMYAECFK
ncbi:hypothetical protein M8J76_014375 [Diaphorina citri]|nr:hypothetical protein M8J76_014375 [Diaphorina citri]